MQALGKSSFLIHTAGWGDLQRYPVGLKVDMTEHYYTFTPIAAFLSDLTEHWSFIKEYVDIV